MNTNRRARRARWLPWIMLALAWSVLALYPDPRLLARAVRHAAAPPIDAAAVAALAMQLPDDGRVLEHIVQTELVPYAVPWQSHGVPWYYPSAAEALARGQGDCQAQAIVLASLLRAKGIPARLVGSIDHIWVEYPGKRATPYENGAVAIAQQTLDGTFLFRWPQIRWRETWAVERAYFWDAMPWPRRALLLGGWLVCALVPVGRRLLTHWWRRSAAPVEHAAGISLYPYCASLMSQILPARARLASTIRRATRGG